MPIAIDLPQVRRLGVGEEPLDKAGDDVVLDVVIRLPSLRRRRPGFGLVLAESRMDVG